jgi:broad specificity phosphatase PhoE
VLTLTVVRHGPTVMNHDGRLRGWMDLGLSEEGKELARNLRVPKLPVFSSDLLRARQTASYFGGYLATPALRPWNVGVYQGRPHAVVHDQLVRYQGQPWLRVPFGEPFDAFTDRLLAFVRSLTEDCVLVTHFRCCKLLQAWEAGNFQSVDLTTLLRDDVAPASVVTLKVPL